MAYERLCTHVLIYIYRYILCLCSASSCIVLVDITPPSTGQAVIGMNRTSSGQYWSLTNQLSAFWSGFNDSDSTIRQYYVSLLRSSASMTLSQADVVSMLTLPASQSSYDCYNHQWQDGDRVQVQVAASNGAQQNTTVSSQVSGSQPCSQDLNMVWARVCIRDTKWRSI